MFNRLNIKLWNNCYVQYLSIKYNTINVNPNIAPAWLKQHFKLKLWARPRLHIATITYQFLNMLKLKVLTLKKIYVLFVLLYIIKQSRFDFF